MYIGYDISWGARNYVNTFKLGKTRATAILSYVLSLNLKYTFYNL